jgi:lipopolysaccharide exporter
MLKDAATGAVWLGLSQWLVRFLGVFSIIILARYLSASDYGVMALINISVSFLETVLVLGIGRFIIAKQSLTTDDLNTAWTFNVLKMIFIGSALFLIAPLIGEFYDTPDLVLPIKLISVSIMIGGFENISADILKKELKFNRVSIYIITPKLIGSIVNIALAVLLESYWALVYGTIAIRITSLIVSYFIHPFRPKFSFKSKNEIWEFSKLSLGSNFAIFIKNKLDSILIGKYYSSEELGSYTMAQTVASIPSTEVTTPVIGSLIPSLSKNKKYPREYIENVTRGLQIVSLIVWPACFGLLTISSEFVDIALSSKWETITLYLPILTLILSVDVIAGYSKQILILEGKLLFAVKCEWILVIYYIFSFPLAMYYTSIDMMLYFKLISSIVMGMAFFYRVSKCLNFNIRQALYQVLSSFFACILIYYLAFVMKEYFAFDSSLMSLTFSFIFWLVVYPVIIYLFWFFIGKPNTIEKLILTFLLKKNRCSDN